MTVPGASPSPDPSSAAERPLTALWLPELGLASCVRGYVARDTVGISLDEHESLNEFPAAPLFAITWFIQGSSEIVSLGDQAMRWPMPSAVVLSGPHTQPSRSRNLGSVNAFMVMLMPDALQALTGIDVGALINRTVSFDEYLPHDWQAMSRQVLQAADHPQRIRLFEAFLAPRWQAIQREALPPMRRYQDWVRALALRAAVSGLGKSLRQVERRVKRWSGLPLRRLHGLVRVEHSFFTARQASRQGTLNWAQVAAESGFADQAHLCREVRRVTGLAPDELRRAIDSEERFWLYRVWE